MSSEMEGVGNLGSEVIVEPSQSNKGPSFRGDFSSQETSSASTSSSKRRTTAIEKVIEKRPRISFSPKMSVLLIKARQRLDYLFNDGLTTTDDAWLAVVKECGWEGTMDAKTAKTRMKNMTDAYKAIIVEEGRCDEARRSGQSEAFTKSHGKRAEILEWLPAMREFQKMNPAINPRILISSDNPSTQVNENLIQRSVQEVADTEPSTSAGVSRRGKRTKKTTPQEKNVPSEAVSKVGKRINNRDLIKSGIRAYCASVASSIAFRTQLLQDIRVLVKLNLEMAERSGIDTSSLKSQLDASTVQVDNINMDHHSENSSDNENDNNPDEENEEDAGPQ